ncbi:MAG: hypothetical protein AAGI23_02735 [Bacteroidota bacterium]
MTRYSLFFALLLAISFAQAQIASDALRFSTLDVTATARNMGVGGAISGLGADLSTMSTNPAGIGAYYFSELVVTPAFTNIQSTSVLQNDPSPASIIEDDTKFLLSNVGFVSVGRPIASSWRTFSFSMGVNQLNSFQQDFRFEGESQGSIVNRFQDQANIGVFDRFGSDLAVEAQAVYDLEGDGFFESDVELNPTALLPKEQVVAREGSTQELFFAFGGNFKDKLLFGASIGVPFLRYEETKTYTENDRADEIEFYQSLEYIERLTTTGAGVNAKLGLIFMPTRTIRLGGAVHTPTRLNLEDAFTTDFTYVFNDGGIEQSTALSPEGNFNYSLRTPWRYLANGGFIVGKGGFITAQAEWLDYGANAFNLTRDSNAPEDADYERELNGQIEEAYENALNLRLGGEVALGDFRVRGGLGLGFSPDVNVEDVNRLWSLGLGYRTGRFFMDAAFRTSILEGSYSPYAVAAPSPTQNISTETTDNRILLTLGIKFGGDR